MFPARAAPTTAERRFVGRKPEPLIRPIRFPFCLRMDGEQQHGRTQTIFRPVSSEMSVPLHNPLPNPAAAVSTGLLKGYQSVDGVYNETLDAEGGVRPHWERVLAGFSTLGTRELARRHEQAQHLLSENGVTYSGQARHQENARPWNLDLMPLVIGASEWRELSSSLIQRAKLLNLILADLYGSQRLLTRGLLPPELVFGHPSFERAFHGQHPPGNVFLNFYAVDLARAPDGRWWVVADRTDVPLGAGYALENRIVVSRVLPGVFRDCQVERLAPFFLSLRKSLQHTAAGQRENPRILLYSRGPGHLGYFEDSFLARYLGYTLAEGGDLAVRDNYVTLKTLGGLLPVDVIMRRVRDQLCDPLEMRSPAAVGVPGLIQATREGRVAVASALGSSLVESPAFLPFLPKICEEMLQQPLAMPSIATWWCGEANAREAALANREQLRLLHAFRNRGDKMLPVTSPTGQDWAEVLPVHGANYIAQEVPARSVMPTFVGDQAKNGYVALRVFLVAVPGGSYVVMPGGLARVAASPDLLDRSVIDGETTKDVWVLSDGPVAHTTLLQPAGQQAQLRRSGADLPSRVADNLFWLGRNAERAEGSCRLLRTVLTRLTGEAESSTLRELPGLVHLLAAQGQIEPGYAIEGIKDLLPPFEQALPSAVLDATQSGSLRSTLESFYHVAAIVRDRISLDSWRIINRIEQDVQALSEVKNVDISDLLSLVNQVLLELSALSGLVMESMTRTQGWRFLDLGRRLERAMHTISLVLNAMPALRDDNPAMLEAVLDVSDSSMTYRSRYLANLQITPVLDLLLTDESNPRSLAFQLVVLNEHVNQLPRDTTQPLHGPEQRITMNALSSIRSVDIEMLSGQRRSSERTSLERMLARLSDQLPKLSELISHRYLIHAGTPRQLAESGQRKVLP